VRKQELYDFIDTKLSAKRLELEKKRVELLTLVKEEVSLDVQGLDGLAKSFSKLVDIMEKAKEEHQESVDYYVTRSIRDVHDLIAFKSLIVDKIFNATAFPYMVHARDEDLKILELKYPKTLLVINSVKKDYETILQAIKDSRKLESELNAVIKSSTSAKDAFKNLTALGVDMKDFVESSAKLPMVQKLSVDVCVINGNC
jgi:hypothetical protein